MRPLQKRLICLAPKYAVLISFIFDQVSAVKYLSVFIDNKAIQHLLAGSRVCHAHLKVMRGDDLTLTRKIHTLSPQESAKLKVYIGRKRCHIETTTPLRINHRS